MSTRRPSAGGWADGPDALDTPDALDVPDALHGLDVSDAPEWSAIPAARLPSQSY